MPELPELEVVREVLEGRVAGQVIEKVEVIPPGGPIVVRDLTLRGVGPALTGARIESIARRGKFLIFSFDAPGPGAGAGVGAGSGVSLYLAINPKLSGRLQLAETGQKRPAKTHVVLTLSGGGQLRYIDQRRMGQVYLTPDLEVVPGYAGRGPEPLETSLELFRARLRPYSGEVKGVLTRGDFIAGIGNAYADEILWEARLHPYRKVALLTADEIDRLHAAMRIILGNAIAQVRAAMGEAIDTEPREFMSVHMKAGQPCPRCGAAISVVSANQRITNFCRACQPGGPIEGMR